MSEFVKGSLVDDYGVDPARVRVVGAGPNVAPERPVPPGGREKAILFVGRNFVPKGGPALLDAFARVRRVHPDARLWIVAARAPPALPDGAVFHGRLAQDALAALYARAAVFALPTLREAFGLSFLEAMAFGLPVVAPRLEAIPEIVSDGETGLLVPPRDPEALARALCDLLGDPLRARLLGAAGRARVAARYGWERAAALMLEVLRPGTAMERASGRPWA
jgi:glycosyltransferase involved in cell wall biosynthesis